MVRERYGRKIFVTGDCHSEFKKFNTENFPEQSNLTKEDYVIICGDFGGIWEPYRIKHRSWWEEELPSAAEYVEALKNLESRNFEVDYILSHCCSTECQKIIVSEEKYASDSLTDFFDIVRSKCEFKKWYFGHYHGDLTVSDKEVLLYHAIISLGDCIETSEFED